jgi:uncharacterized membrane protein
LVNLGGPWLWYDESGSAWMATLPFQNMLAATAGDTHPPLYFVILWSWVRLAGASPFAVRLPSLLFSLAAIPVAWRVGERLNLSRPALTVAACLIALLPSQLHYGQEARMYSLFQLELWIAVWSALCKRPILYGLAVGAMLLTHNYGLVYAPTLAALYLWRIAVSNDPRGFFYSSQSFLWAHSLALALYLPWLAVLREQMQTVAAGYWLQPVTPGGAVYPLYFMLWGFSPPGLIQTHAALIAFGLVALVASAAVMTKRGELIALAWLAVMPLCTAILLSLAWRPVLLFRGLWPSSIALALLAGWWIARTAPARRWVMAFILVPVLAVCMVNYYVTIGDSKGGAAPVARAIDYRPGDLVMHANEGSLMALRFYSPPAWRQYLLMGNGYANLGALTPATRQAMAMQYYDLHSGPWRRAWLVVAASPTVAQEEDRIVAALLAEYPHLAIREKETDLTREAVYLLWNHGVGVP